MKRLALTLALCAAALSAPAAPHSTIGAAEAPSQPDTLAVEAVDVIDDGGSIEIVSEYAAAVIPASSAPDLWQGYVPPEPALLSPNFGRDALKLRHGIVSPYAVPYSTTFRPHPQWKRLWVNTGVLVGAYVGALVVLECLPEDATTWNRAEIRQTPLFTRWYQNVFVRHPEFDNDNPVFNYVLHPYAGAAYFMAARSCGFNFYQSMLYSFCISTFGWEFGIEAFMERPSYQDLVITPVVGSLLGELFFAAKHSIVQRGYSIAGSTFLGHTVAFLLDPVNEFLDIFRGSPERDYARHLREARHTGALPAIAYTHDTDPTSNDRELRLLASRHPVAEGTLLPTIISGAPGITITCRF